jgi:uroporphyrinogen decarboxylase
MNPMTKKERVMAAVKGNPVDRIPVSFFGHNHTAERFPETAVQAMLEQDRKFDWDFMKVQMRATYYAEAWGCKYDWMGPDIGPEVLDHVVKQADDFRKLKRLDVTRGVLGDHVGIGKKIGEALKGRTPYVQTIFSPLSVADMLAGTRFHQYPRIGPLKRLIEEKPEAVHEGLTVISQTLADYAKEAVRAGADGILLTTWRWALKDVLTEEQYKIFGKPYDLAVIEGAVRAGATFSILHICRENIIFDPLADYPVEVISFNATSPLNPTLREAMGRTKKALWGGIDHTQTLLHGPVEAIAREVNVALEQTGGRRFMLGPGCAIPPQVPEAHLRAAQASISQWGKG